MKETAVNANEARYKSNQAVEKGIGIANTTAEESAAASEELSSQTQMLKNLMGQFKFREVPTASKIIQTTKNNLPTSTVITNSVAISL